MASTDKPEEEPTAKPKEKRDKVEPAKVDAKDEDLMNMAGKFAEVTATIKEVRRSKKGDHLTVLVEGSKFMLFCRKSDIVKVFGEGDPLEKLAAGTRVKVRGKIALFRDQPQIVLRTADQLAEMEAEAGVPVSEIGEEVGKEE